MKFILATIVLLTINIVMADDKTETPYGVFKTRQELKEYENKVFKKSNRHEFDLSGYIVDDDGMPVDDVKMEVSLSQNAWSWRGSKYTTSSDGDKFQLNTPECRSASIKFSKIGYYSTNVSASYLSITEKKLKYNFQYDGSTIKADGIKVEMVKMGELDPKIMRLSGSLRIEIINDNNSKEYKLDVIKVPGEFYHRDEQQNGKITKNLTRLPKDFIYMTSDVVNGEFKTKRAYKSNDDGYSTYYLYVPESVTLQTNDPEGGLILVPNTSQDLFRRMKEAPLDGYQQQIKINDFSFIGGRGINSAKRIYFYFKVNNCYGKCFIDDFNNMANYNTGAINKKVIKFGYEVRINPVANDRNLNTEEY